MIMFLLMQLLPSKYALHNTALHSTAHCMHEAQSTVVTVRRRIVSVRWCTAVQVSTEYLFHIFLLQPKANKHTGREHSAHRHS